MRIAFAGTPEFAAVALADLHAAGHEIALLLTQPDRPAGRGMKLQASAVKAFAMAHAIPVAQPRSLRLDGKYPDDAAVGRDALLAAQPEVLIVAAYGLILPTWVLALPPRGAINIHASLLPRWRGAAPIHRAIEAGDARTGITIMQMNEGLDTGDTMLVGETAIEPDDSTATLHDRLAAMGGRLIVQTLAQPDAWVRTPQPVDGVTYAGKIEKVEAAIDWREPAAVIERRIRAFDPFPGALATLDGESLKVWRASVVADGAGDPGTVIGVDAQGVVVACGHQSLRIVELQRPGGRRIAAAQFARIDGLLGRRFATLA